MGIKLFGRIVPPWFDAVEPGAITIICAAVIIRDRNRKRKKKYMKIPYKQNLSETHSPRFDKATMRAADTAKSRSESIRNKYDKNISSIKFHKLCDGSKVDQRARWVKLASERIPTCVTRAQSKEWEKVGPHPIIVTMCQRIISIKKQNLFWSFVTNALPLHSNLAAHIRKLFIPPPTFDRLRSSNNRTLDCRYK